MAEFEELKLTVTLTDNASAGIAALRAQLGQLTATAGQASASLAQIAQGFGQVGGAAAQMTPAVRGVEATHRDLSRSAEATTRGMMQMALSVRGGIGSFPQLALGLREAIGGIKGMSEALTILAPELRLAVLGVTAIGVAATAIVTTAAAAGVTLFKFSQSMNQLSQTAKSMGLTFADVKNAIDIAEHFGTSADIIIGNLNGIGKAQSDLAKGGSELRQEMFSRGLEGSFINQLTDAADPVKFQRLVHQRFTDQRNYLMKEKGMSQAAATARVNEDLKRWFGFDAGFLDRDAPRPPTEAERARYFSIEKQSNEIAKVWADISHYIRMIGATIKDWAIGPLVLVPLQFIKRVFDQISAEIRSIKDTLKHVWEKTPDPVKGALRWVRKQSKEGSPGLGSKVEPLPGYEGWEKYWRAPKEDEGRNLFRGTLPEQGNKPSLKDFFFGPANKPGGGVWPRAGTVAPGATPQAAPRTPNPLAERVDYRTGANDNSRSLLQLAGYTTSEEDNVTETGRLTEQMVRLNAFFDRLETEGGNAAGAGGAGLPGGGGYGGTPIFRRGIGGGRGGGGGGGGGGVGGSGTPGGPAQLTDEKGRPVDAETMSQVEALGRAGDTAGLQKLFAQKGYHASGAYCGIVASKYVRSAGFKPPEGSAIATNWHNWGQQGSVEDINTPGRPFGSMVATYYHRRYGGNLNELQKPGDIGGHVMTIIPGTYNPKTKKAWFADQNGLGVSERSVSDMDIRYAGDQSVAEARRARGEKVAETAGNASTVPNIREQLDKANAAGGGADVLPQLSNFVAGKEQFRSHPFPDYGTIGIGYGTPAAGRTSITEPEARKEMEGRLTTSLARIRAMNPNLTTGQQQALASLDFNTGWTQRPGEKNEALRAAIKSGDLGKARELFGTYTHVGGPHGKVLPGLASRRQEELGGFWDRPDKVGAPKVAVPPVVRPTQAMPPVQDISSLDRSPVDRKNGRDVNSKMSVNVRAPSGTKVNYDGDNLLKATSTERSTPVQEAGVATSQAA